MEPTTTTPITDEEIETVWHRGDRAAGKAETRDLDTKDADGTDAEDAEDADGTDSQDQDGTDSRDADGTDADSDGTDS